MITLAELLTRRVAERRARLATRPEGIEVLCLTDDIGIAEAVAPLLARRIHPGRRIGDVVAILDPVDGRYPVVVADLGPVSTHP